MRTSVSLLAFALASASGTSINNNSELPTVDLAYQVHRAISFNETTKLYNFTNIPYAEPPLGQLRWNAPVPPKGRKDGIQDGSVGKICPQQNPDWLNIGFLFAAAYATNKLPFNYTLAKEIVSHLPPAPADPRITEDCLVLDVLVPKTVFDAKQNKRRGYRPPTKGAPVIAYIHGGGYVIGEKGMLGSPNDLLIATQQGQSDGAIFVSLNYRLGAFGFLSGSTLQADGASNVGLLDQRLALQWIQANIHKFGGDPDNVTIMGVSAGGGSVMHQVTAYGGRKPAPFRRAIPQSSGFQPTPQNGEQEQIFNEFLSILNVSSIHEARSLPSSALLAANGKHIAAAPYGTFVYGPTVDHDFVPDLPPKLLAKGAYAKNTAIFSSYVNHDGLLFTDPRAIEDENYLTAELQHFVPTISEKTADFVVKTLYPPKYDGSKPYKDTLDRAQLMIGEAAFICNQNSLLESAAKHGVPAFGYEFAVSPGLHGNDQSGYVFGRGPTPGVDAEIASVIQYAIAGFAIDGVPRKSPTSALSFSPYAKGQKLLSFAVGSSQLIRDPSANDRCDWWQKAQY
ncbi:Carboxylesterase patB [Cladobotryum mycophilum]|uniref:Carboxylic ester hydrolase n=1 Tax=Cladobotryum mycophilum TaxID=491253 RepID=A0ABR0SQA1_9HYPO